MPHDAHAKRSWPVFGSLASYALPGDLIAGLTLAAIAIPEQMATARLGGFAPQIGFFADPAGCVPRHRAIAAARHLEHDARTAR